MITQQLQTLKINKLTQEQFDKAAEAGVLQPDELYLIPEAPVDSEFSLESIRPVQNKVISKALFAGAFIDTESLEEVEVNFI